MNKRDTRLIVIYICIPLIIAMFSIPCFVEGDNLSNYNEQMQSDLLFPRLIERQRVGLMNPYTSSDSSWQDYEAVKGVLDEISSTYIYQDRATGSDMDENQFLDTLRYDDVGHLASHGHYSSTFGPCVKVTTSSTIYEARVNGWSSVGSRCDVMVLSACCSMGSESISTPDTSLAQALISKSGIDHVIGYRGVVDSGGLAVFAAFFWVLHLWANAEDGGMDSVDAFWDAKDALNDYIDDNAFWAAIFGIIIGTVVSIIIAIVVACLSLTGVGAIACGIAASAIGGVLASWWTGLPYDDCINSLSLAEDRLFQYGTGADGPQYIFPDPPPPPPSGGGGRIILPD